MIDYSDTFSPKFEEQQFEEPAISRDWDKDKPVWEERWPDPDKTLNQEEENARDREQWDKDKNKPSSTDDPRGI